MAKQTPHASLDSLLLASTQDLASAQRAHADACLALALQPKDIERINEVTGLEQEIREHELAIQRLRAAKLATSEAAVQETQAQRIKAARDAANAVADTTPKIKAALERLVEVFDLVIGPTLAELDSLSRERGSLSWAATVSALGTDQARRNRAALDHLQADTHMTSTLMAALLRSGLTQVGPKLDPWVTVSTPFRGMGAPEQAIEGFGKQAQKLDAYLADAIERAANPKPATEDLE